MARLMRRIAWPRGAAGGPVREPVEACATVGQHGARHAANWLLRLFLAWTGLAGIAPALAGESSVWLAGMDPYVRRVQFLEVQSDYAALFEPDAKWRDAASATAVFKTSTQWVVHASDAQLRSMFADLKRRRIALALEALMVRLEGHCGRGIEGYSAPEEIRRAALRIRDLGGNLAFIAMDEPLFYGHHFRGPNACQAEIGALAANVALNVRAVREVFPNVQIGDIEPVSPRAGADWVEKIVAWAKAYEAATGESLAFFHVDMDWDDPAAMPMLLRLKAQLDSLRIRFGLIYNGDPTDSSDAAWLLKAQRRYERIESDARLRPEHAILQTWMRRPARMLPDGDPDAMTNLVLRYRRARTSLEAAIEGPAIAGALRSDAGRPVASAEVHWFATPISAKGELLPRAIVGTVPPGATTALVGVRLNTECDCSGEGFLAIGDAEYREASAKAALRVDLRRLGAMAGAASTFRAAPGVKYLGNSEPFKVSAGETFRLDFGLRTTQGLYQGGYVALIFLDAASREVLRMKASFRPDEVDIGKAVTDRLGRFRAKLPAEGWAGSLTLKFAGSEVYRGTEQVIPGPGR